MLRRAGLVGRGSGAEMTNSVRYSLIVARDKAWDRAAVDLYTRFQDGLISSDEMVTELPNVWSWRSDVDPLSAEKWRAMFDHAGYFVWKPGRNDWKLGNYGGRRRRRPLLRQRLYRGATISRRLGMSWTKNPDIALHFARNRQPPTEINDGIVWVGVFEPRRLLAYIDHEKEYLVDTTGVDVEMWKSGSEI